jgi:hypothetical protein
MPDTPLCGLPHYTWPETVCTEPAGHYRPNADPHAGPLIIDSRHRGGCAWDEPATPEKQTPDDTPDDYAQATGHEITCTAGFNDHCTCGTAPNEVHTLPADYLDDPRINLGPLIAGYEEALAETGDTP